MQVTLKRGTPIEFTFEAADGTRFAAVIPAITVGQYRAAIALEKDAGGGALQPNDRLIAQAHILCGPAHEDFVNALDPEQLGECVQALVAAYSGMDPEAMVEVMRGLKKKSLLEMALAEIHRPSSSSATS